MAYARQYVGRTSISVRQLISRRKSAKCTSNKTKTGNFQPDYPTLTRERDISSSFSIARDLIRKHRNLFTLIGVNWRTSCGEMVGILLQMKRFKVDIFEAGDVRLLKDMVSTDCENINQTDAVHQTALHKAAMNGWLDCVVVLVESGVDVNSVDDCGCTALHYAAANGYISVVKYLVQVGHADFRLKSNKGYEPQHMARRRGQVKLATFLSEGALVNGW